MDAGLNPRMLRKHLSTFRGRWDTSEEIKYRFLRVKQLLRLHIIFPAAPWTLDKTAVLRCLPHTRSDCPFCLSLSSLSLAGKHAWLSFPPSLPSSLLPHTNTHCSHTAFLRSLLTNSQRLQHKRANGGRLLFHFHVISFRFGLEHLPLACLLQLCELLFHPWVPLKPVPLASLSIKPVDFASSHVRVSKCCNC